MYSRGRTVKVTILIVSLIILSYVDCLALSDDLLIKDNKFISSRFELIDSIHGLSNKEKNDEKTWIQLTDKVREISTDNENLRKELEDMIDAAKEQHKASRQRGLLRRVWEDYILYAFRAMGRKVFGQPTARKLERLRAEKPGKFKESDKVAILKLSALEESGIPLSKGQLELLERLDKSTYSLDQIDLHQIESINDISTTQLKLNRFQNIKEVFEKNGWDEGSTEEHLRNYQNAARVLVKTIKEEKKLSKEQIYFVNKLSKFGESKKSLKQLVKDKNINLKTLAQN